MSLTYDHASRELLVDRRGHTLALTVEEADTIACWSATVTRCPCGDPAETGERSCRAHLPAGHVARAEP